MAFLLHSDWNLPNLKLTGAIHKDELVYPLNFYLFSNELPFSFHPLRNQTAYLVPIRSSLK